MPFDLESYSVTGEPFTILPNVAVWELGATQFQVSETGTALYAESSPGGPIGLQELLIVDLQGNEEALPLDARPIERVNWSPDGQSISYSWSQSPLPLHDLYTYNVTLGTTPRQITFEGANQWGVFSPDGTRIAFSSGREGTESYDLFIPFVCFCRRLGSDVF